MNQFEIKSKAAQDQWKRVEGNEQTKYDPNMLNKSFYPTENLQHKLLSGCFKAEHEHLSTMICSTCSGLLDTWGHLCMLCSETKNDEKHMIAKV